MTTLLVPATTDFTSSTLSGIDLVDFTSESGSSQAVFLSSQFGPGLIADTVTIDGGLGGDLVQILMAAGDSAFDASGWAFTNWFLSSVAIQGSGANDVITGSVSSDAINGGAGNDTLNGGDGDDSLISELDNGADRLIGGSGTDQALVNRSTSATAFVIDVSAGGAGLDIGDGTTLAGVEQIAAYLGTGNDRITGGNFSDLLDGGGGNDILTGQDGANQFNGGSGNDVLSCISTTGQCIYDGGSGIDSLMIHRAGTTSRFIINLGIVNSDIGDGSRLEANIEILNFLGGSGNDVVSGGGRKDKLSGGSGNDALNGRAADDTLIGGAGADILIGSIGADTLTGGTSSDRFTFQSITHSVTGIARDVVTDFVSGVDKIDLRSIGGLAFHGLSAFSGAAGEIIATKGTASTVVGIDIDGDRDADMEIGFTGLISFQTGDFLV